MDDIILETQQLCVSYRDRPVLEDINLAFRAGKRYAVIGPNGCGKTTLMRTLCRNLRPTSGRVLLRGQDLHQLNTKLVARHIGILAQNNAALPDVTVRTLVQYGRYAYRAWWRGGSDDDSQVVDWALDRTGMAAFADRRLDALSGGERQRAWIAMSIAQRPELLLLDEPTTYLDISHQLEIMELVTRLNREEGITVLMVLHDLNHAARYADELIVLNERKVFAQGDPWALLQGGIPEQVFRVQAEMSRDAETGTPIFYAKKVVKSE